LPLVSMVAIETNQYFKQTKQPCFMSKNKCICQYLPKLWALLWYENGCLWQLSFHKVV